MSLLPVRTVPLRADVRPAALAELLRGCVSDGLATPFAGSVAGDGFAIRRFNEYHSHSMPLVRGTLVASPDGGTAVQLRLRTSNTVVVFMVIWLGFLAAVAALIVVAHARDAARGLLPLVAPVGLAALSWYLMLSVFAAEVRWAIEALRETLPILRAAGTGAAEERR